jgi:signal transduction histidine kinase
MSQAIDPSPEERVLILAPPVKSHLPAREELDRTGWHYLYYSDIESMCKDLERGAAAVIVPEESLNGTGEARLASAVANQPAWSDLPVLLLTPGREDAKGASRNHQGLGNVTLLDQPVRLAVLVSAVGSALKARRLQYQVRDHLAERMRFSETLREADRRRDEFLAMLAHELRNPLAPIRNALQVLRLRPSGEPVVDQMTGMMGRQVDHLVRLIDDLLDVSRIVRGKIELRLEYLALADVVVRAVEGVRPWLDERCHLLSVELPPEELWLEADPARLEQVLANLLTNACKYTAPGGQIRLLAAREGGDIVVHVRDNGIGIRPELLTVIFEMFAQGDRVPGRLLEGLGLGLSLVRSLVEMHGGTVVARSDGVGQGSEFIVRVPSRRDEG